MPEGFIIQKFGLKDWPTGVLKTETFCPDYLSLATEEIGLNFYMINIDI